MPKNMNFFLLQSFITAANLLMSLTFIDSTYNILYALVLTESKSDVSRLHALKMTNNKSCWMFLCRWHLLIYVLKNNSKSLNSNLIRKVPMTVESFSIYLSTIHTVLCWPALAMDTEDIKASRETGMFDWQSRKTKSVRVQGKETTWVRGDFREERARKGGARTTLQNG